MNFGWLRFHWLVNRRVGRSLLWVALLIAVAIIFNLIGIRMLGSIKGWEHWMGEHAIYFLIWRLLLYAGTAYGWWWMRKRLRAREPEAASNHRLMRVEIAAVLAFIALEGSLLLQSS